MTTLEIINQIEEDKKRGHIYPYKAQRKDIALKMGISYQKAFELLKSLENDNMIKVGKTINDYYIKVL